MRQPSSLLVGMLLAFSSVSFAQETDANNSANSISVSPITYQNEQLIERAIVTDCDLPNVQRNELNKHSAQLGLVLNNTTEEAAATGRVLHIQIANAIASGNAFIGHSKQVTLTGKLIENGQEIASFNAMRSSGGGAFAGFKSSCSVLHRCAVTLGKDVSEWLRNPVPNARLGELK